MIPKLLHHIWLGGDGANRSRLHRACRQSAVDLHPKWKASVYGDGDALMLMRHADFEPITKPLVKAWGRFAKGDQRHSGATIQADLLRLMVLYRFGGIYMDYDLFCIRPLDEFCDRDLLLAQWREGHPGEFLIGAPPQSDAIWTVLTAFIEHGPAPIITMNLFEHANRNGWHSFPPEYFCPHGLGERGENLYRTTPNTHAIHLWRGLEYDLDRLRGMQQKQEVAA